MPLIQSKSGINWSYELEGEGSEVLLFIHGWGVDKRIWRQQTKYFSQKFKVLTIDLPGHGKSSWQKVTFKVMAEDLKDILRQLGFKKIAVIGSSIGGILSLKLYDAFPEVIQKLVFVGSMPKFSKSDDYPYGLDVEQIRKLSGKLKTAYPSIIHIFFRSLFTHEERETRRFRWLQRFRRNEDVPGPEALGDYLEILEKEDLRGVLKKVHVPMQFINGTGDTICNRESVGFLKELVPQSRFDDFHKCGHFPFLSKPYEFNAILEEFLRS